MNKQQQSDISILIADDHPMVRAGLRSLLNSPGLRVVGDASTGKEAVELAAILAPDIVLMDIRMPDMDGIAALQAIKESQHEARVIMVTTYKNTAYLLRAMAAGAAGFVLKDISRDDLLATVRTVAAGASLVDRKFLQDVIRNLDESRGDRTELALEHMDPLTPRETDVLRMLVEGLTNQAIADVLGLRPGTVKGYVQVIFEKLNVTDRTQAAVKAIRVGLVK